MTTQEPTPEEIDYSRETHILMTYGKEYHKEPDIEKRIVLGKEAEDRLRSLVQRVKIAERDRTLAEVETIFDDQTLAECASSNRPYPQLLRSQIASLRRKEDAGV